MPRLENISENSVQKFLLYNLCLYFKYNLIIVSLKEWIKNKKRTIWFRVHLPHSEWVPILVKNGFKFHHAREEYVTLYQWLSTDEKCNVPHYAHTNLGVGAFVYNEKTDELLVIKEKYINKAPFWKLPGGFVEPGT